MNIFVLDRDPKLAATAMCDKHVNKLLVESAQILSTVQRANGYDIGYKATHQNHPCTLWAGKSKANYLWLLDHAFALCDEYTKRYNKIHATQTVLGYLMAVIPVDGDELTPFVQCMPDEYKCDDPVQAYRNYYLGSKSRFAKWKLGNEPIWWATRGEYE